MKDMFQNLTAMMTLLTTWMDLMDRGGRKKRKVVFCSCASVPDTSSPPDSASTATTQPPTSLRQPHDHRTGLPSTHAVTKPLSPLVPELMSQEATYQEGAPSQLPDVSEAVRTRVAQRLQGAPAPFLLTGHR